MEDKLELLMDECFPLRTRRVKESDPPWITHSIRKLVKKRNDMYKRNRGAYEELKTLVEQKISRSRTEYVERIKTEAEQQRSGKSSFINLSIN